MEEDLKVLERLKERFEKEYPYCNIWGNEIQAIENFIKRNKELETINKMQEYRISVIDERELIPKSKVQKFIEKNTKYISFGEQDTYLQGQRDENDELLDKLQELLQDKE